MIPYYGRTIRSIVEYANNNDIKKDQIVSILRDEASCQYVLLYYK